MRTSHSLAQIQQAQPAILKLSSLQRPTTLSSLANDYDFVNYFHLTGKPRLLLISTGNITNNELLALLLKQLPQIEKGFELFDFIAITRTQIVYHA